MESIPQPGNSPPPCDGYVLVNYRSGPEYGPCEHKACWEQHYKDIAATPIAEGLPW